MPILSANARLAGLLGWPVAHSRSPLIHNYWLQRYSIDGVYVPLPARPKDLADAIRGLQAAGFAGVNVTIPHKVAALTACDRLEGTARRAGAVNTLFFRDGGIIGANTDGFGFVSSLSDQGVDLTAGPALVLGAGGAARAIAASLQDHSVAVTVCNRTRARAEALARELPGLAVLEWSDRRRALADHALLVNATSLGMPGRGSLDMPLDRAHPSLAVVDIVYVPLETPLLADARQRGLNTVDGLGMLLQQARPGFAGWFGVDPVVDSDLRRLVAADLGRP